MKLNLRHGPQDFETEPNTVGATLLKGDTFLIPCPTCQAVTCWNKTGCLCHNCGKEECR